MRVGPIVRVIIAVLVVAAAAAIGISSFFRGQSLTQIVAWFASHSLYVDLLVVCGAVALVMTFVFLRFFVPYGIQSSRDDARPSQPLDLKSSD
jgi:hypothetical protein